MRSNEKRSTGASTGRGEKTDFAKKRLVTSRKCQVSIENDRPYLLVLLLQGEFLLLHLFQLVTEIKFGSLLLQLGELILVLGYLLQGRFHARVIRKRHMMKRAESKRGDLNDRANSDVILIVN